MPGEALTVVLDESQFRAAEAALTRIGPAFAPLLRDRLLPVGEHIAGDVRGIIRAYPVKAGGRRQGVRDQLADSIIVRPYGRGASQGVLVISTGRLLPERKRALVKAWNTSEYRHPVFGSRRWVSQEGVRYFRQSVADRRQGELAAAVTGALEDAIRQTGAAA